MSSIKSQKPDLILAANRALLAHWEKLRGDRRAPLRSDFNPMQVPSHLPHLIMLEPNLPESSIIRIFGTELVRRLGLDLTGHDIFSLYEGEEQDKVRELTHLVADEEAIALVYSSWNTPTGYSFKTENLWLPLASPDGNVTRILGCIWELEAFDDENLALGGSVAEALGVAERSFFQF